jgi:hypothetical protein
LGLAITVIKKCPRPFPLISEFDSVKRVFNPKKEVGHKEICPAKCPVLKAFIILLAS